MRTALFSTIVAFLLALPVVGFSDQVLVDGSLADITIGDLPGNTVPGPDGVAVIDIVGDTSNQGTGAGRAKGNSYRVDTSVVLNEAEFWLNFTSSQTLVYYVFESPVEFGTYTEIYRDPEMVNGTGAGWYSSGPLSIAMSAGMHYIIAVSWDGTLSYYYGTGDSQPTSFGAHTHGYATGLHPLPAQFSSTVNDQAIYHQRLTTDAATPVEAFTWGGVKSLYR